MHIFRKIFLLILIYFSFLPIHSQTNYCSKYANEQVIYKTHLTISYNKKYKIPNYIGYILTRDFVSGYASRETQFYQDTVIDIKYRLLPSDYTSTGYDRGHMSPAADWLYSQKAMKESFVLSNVCPQDPVLNRKYWIYVENIERNFTVIYDSVFVVTGSIVGKNKKYIKNNIVVPVAFYKVIVVTKNNNVKSFAWLYTNTNNILLEKERRTTIKNIEKIIHKKLFVGFWFRNKIE